MAEMNWPCRERACSRGAKRVPFAALEGGAAYRCFAFFLTVLSAEALSPVYSATVTRYVGSERLADAGSTTHE